MSGRAQRRERSVDLRDQKIASRLATGQQSSRELVQIAGDEGVAHTINMAHGKHEAQVVYRDFLLTVDVYALPHEPLQVHLICPKCRNQLRVPGDRKQIDWDPGTGELSIEAFQCTWELPEAGAHKAKDAKDGTILIGSSTMCRWRVGITKNRALDA